MSTNGPATWAQPIFTALVPPIVVNGQAVEAFVDSWNRLVPKECGLRQQFIDLGFKMV